MAGLPKKYAKMGFKKGWKAYKKTKRGRKPSKRRTTRRNPKVARRRYYRKRRRRGKTKVSLATMGGLVAGITTKTAHGTSVVESVMAGDWEATGKNLLMQYTGVDAYTGKFDIMQANGIKFLVIGALISKFVGGWPLHINRKLASIPFIKI